ncbi:MAG: hypothetical protein NC337_08240 [Roseburia sp.]|nr:hypothetical protein [Roseburia sp.]
MWNVVDENDYKLFISKKIDLKIKVCEEGEDSKVYVNYKGYNIVFVMEVWGFGMECEEWDIQERMRGDVVKNPADVCFVIRSLYTRPFIDLIYFFIVENSADSMLREEYRVEW